MNLIIDFGNTSIKAALFDGPRLIETYTGISTEHLIKLSKENNPEYLIVSSVTKSQLEVSNLLGADIIYLSSSLPLPFQINYKTPQTLGLDRIAGIAGAQELFPNQNVLVIDLGTCITYDLIDSKNVYHGGGISPGLKMRFKSLHNFTAKLPLIEPTNEFELIGQSTKESILSGVINGMISEIDGIIRMYTDKFAHLRIIMCGGDAKFFENRIKANIFVAPELVLMGLNRILLYNV
ncbi:type III pantothenate kinase [Fulvivirga sediminis]|uniref:Type III pantothenate kinase n=1 Tax=Fulvivirga sediminis TaxID=2803949 RepID=A0A937F9C7_9BACT|nr:type III pantothenate kinase [Fulvivirga sediminis]MBL3657014.1 type III pantothenate kinase [Fulvivirga sediminis]